MTETVALPKLEATVRPYHDASGRTEILGFADLVIGGAFVIKGIRILLGKPKDGKPGGPFISFPSRKGSGPTQDKYFEVSHPITAEARAAAKEAVLEAFRRSKAGA